MDVDNDITWDAFVKLITNSIFDLFDLFYKNVFSIKTQFICLFFFISFFCCCFLEYDLCTANHHTQITCTLYFCSSRMCIGFDVCKAISVEASKQGSFLVALPIARTEYMCSWFIHKMIFYGGASHSHSFYNGQCVLLEYHRTCI